MRGFIFILGLFLGLTRLKWVCIRGARGTVYAFGWKSPFFWRITRPYRNAMEQRAAIGPENMRRLIRKE